MYAMKLGARRAIVGLVAAALVVMIALLAGQSSTGASPGAASIALEDFRFTPNRLDAKVGVPLSVRLTNQGTEQHDLNFPSLHMPGLGGVESILAPGETTTVTLEFDQPGTHTFICTLPGHAAAGMTGAVYVSQ
jgi:nitrite reductase (NO-forming)